MRTLFAQVAVHFIFITLIACCLPHIATAADPFEIQIFDGNIQIMPPYTLISGQQYRLQAATSDKNPVAASWFIAGNLGSITGTPPILSAIFVGEGHLLCRRNGMLKRVKLTVVPATKTFTTNGGTLKSPAGVEIELPKGALPTEQKIGIEIVGPPGVPIAAKRLVRVVRISPARLVLKRSARITFLLGTDAQPHLYFWEGFQKRWVPLQSRVNVAQGTVTASINHFGIYTLMVPETTLKRTNRLKIQRVTLSPRVFFAPERHRLTITYQLNAPDASQALVTMDIFDLRGRRIRRLLNSAVRHIGPNAEQWDGLTDDGVIVRNGRYILVIHAKAAAQNVIARKLIVVFK